MVHCFSPDRADSADRDSPLVGFVIPKTVGNAVVRNRIRRQLRHLMRDRLDRLNPWESVVIRVFPQAQGKSSVQLAGDLDRAWSKAAKATR